MKVPFLILYQIPLRNFDPLENITFRGRPTLVVLASGATKALMGLYRKRIYFDIPTLEQFRASSLTMSSKGVSLLGVKYHHCVVKG